MVFFLTVNFQKKESVQNGKSQIIKHKIDPNLLIFTSSIGGFLGVYAGIWIFDYEKNNFYLSWGNLIILIYNIV